MSSHRRNRCPGYGALVVAFVCLGTFSARAQQAATGATLVVGGDVPTPLSLTLSEIKAMPRAAVTFREDDRDVKYEGVWAGEILKRAGAPMGLDPTRAAVEMYVLASAKDGFQVLFSLPELDPGFTSNEILVADTIDGKPLMDSQGPLRIVAPHDKRGARSIRTLQKLNVVRLRK